jgi:IclR helix-turn-helix domain
MLPACTAQQHLGFFHWIRDLAQDLGSTEDHLAEVDRMLYESNVPRNSSYLVPCLFKAVQMIEALREMRSGLRVEDFQGRTGYSRSTIYRILRTLSACDYIVRASGGVYRLNHSVISVADEDLCARPVRRPTTIGTSVREGPSEFERWGVRFRQDGRRVEELSQHDSEPVTHSRTDA